MSGKHSKALRKAAKAQVDQFNSDVFLEFVMSWSLWKRLCFCFGIMFKVRERK
jgi:hypothetical protein